MFIKEIMQQSFRLPRNNVAAYYSEKAIRKKLRKETDSKCCFCGNKINGDISLEHVIPQIILRMGGKQEKFAIAHQKCNSNSNHISDAIGMIVKSHHMSAIQKSARYLCNLVRNKYENFGSN